MTIRPTGNAKRGSFFRLSGASGQHLSISCSGRWSRLNAPTMILFSSRTISARSITLRLMSSANCITTTAHSTTRDAQTSKQRTTEYCVARFVQKEATRRRTARDLSPTRKGPTSCRRLVRSTSSSSASYDRPPRERAVLWRLTRTDTVTT